MTTEIKTNFYALFSCGKQVQAAEQLIESYNQDLAEHGNPNSYIVERIVASYRLAATEANRAGWDKEIDFAREADRWQQKLNEIAPSDKPYDLDNLDCTID